VNDDGSPGMSKKPAKYVPPHQRMEIFQIVVAQAA
jgi:hypothetical protein